MSHGELLGPGYDLFGDLTSIVATDQVRLRWSSLTRLSEKVRWYSVDPYFREGLRDALDTFAESAADILATRALILIKRDGLETGKAPAIVDFLEKCGFQIVLAEHILINRWHWRELWRYQLSAATVERLEVNDLIMQGEAVLLVARYTGSPDVPASVRLSALKGPSDISKQPIGCLRRLLAQPSRLFSLLHTSDEPADIVRELAILLDRPARLRLLTTICMGALPDSDRRVLDRLLLGPDGPVRTFDVALALQRLEQQAREVGSGPGQRVIEYILEVRAGNSVDWRLFTRAVHQAQLNVDRWDLALIGSAIISFDVPSIPKLIRSAGLAKWSHNHSIDGCEQAPMPAI